MNVFLTGATGFIGRRLLTALLERGHGVTCAVREPERTVLPGARVVAGDFARDFHPATWLPRLTDVDVVVNTVGIIREAHTTFDAIHRRAPIALFSAAVTVGVRRIVQLSALGADRDAQSRYHLSKRAADEFLEALPIDWVIVQPSLVVGTGGASTRLFATLSSLPWILVPGDGRYEVQPIHVDDVIAALVVLIESPMPQQRRVSLVGPEALRFDEYLARWRSMLGMAPARVVRVPLGLMNALASASELSSSLLDRDTLGMLLRGNADNPDPVIELLERPLTSPFEFVADHREEYRTTSQLRWLAPALRVSVAIVWIVTGVLSLGIYPVELSYELLGQLGLHGVAATTALYGGAMLDIGFGIATLIAQRRRMLWLLQMATIVVYSLLIAIWLPEFWLHPFGPLLKNIPLLAVIFLLYQLEPRKWNT